MSAHKPPKRSPSHTHLTNSNHLANPHHAGSLIKLQIHSLIKATEDRSGFTRVEEETRGRIYAKTCLTHDMTAMKVVIIKGGRDNIQLPHFHQGGFDFFMVVGGRGRVHVAPVVNGRAADESWTHYELVPGSFYSISPGQAHCIQNLSEDDFIFANVAPNEHSASDYVLLPRTDIGRLISA